MIQYLLTALVCFFVGVLAFRKPDNKAAKALAGLGFCLGLWSLELYFLTAIKDVALLSVLFHVTRCGMFFIPSMLALLVWRLVSVSARKFYSFVVFPALFTSGVISLANLFFFPSLLQETSSGGYLPKIDAIYYIFAILVVYCIVSSLVFCIVSYNRVTMRQKRRIRWLMITLALSFVAGVSSLLLVPYDFYLSKFVGGVANISFVLLLFYTTVQHHLIDLRIALSEGFARIVTLSFFIVAYQALQIGVDELSSSVYATMIMLAFIALSLEMYPRLLKWLLPNARRFLAKDVYNYDEVIEETAKALHDVVDYKNLHKVCDHLFVQVMRVTGYTILAQTELKKRGSPEFLFVEQLKNTYGHSHGVNFCDESPESLREIFRDYNAASCIAIRHAGECVGMLMIGQSSDLSYYRYDDIRLFEWLQTEIGQVLNRIDQLEEMQEQLGQAKKTLSMLGVMNHYHHDIKAPLTIIDGVLSNDIYDKEKQKAVVLEQVERGSRLIATMASILKGERKRKVQLLSLEELVKDSIFLFSQGIDSIEYDFNRVPEIYGDAEDLKILLINVIKNATEARDSDRPLHLNVSSYVTDETAVLCIRDTGKGMPREAVLSLWDGAESTKISGSGIGTQAIKRIADEHSAKITVESELNEGTAFLFAFPLPEEQSQHFEQPDSDAETSQNENYFGGPQAVNKPLAG